MLTTDRTRQAAAALSALRLLCIPPVACALAQRKRIDSRK
jgi:hypothetical protein